MTDCLLSATEINELQNHDDFKVIWFGSDNYVSNELNNFTDYLEKYCSFEECYNHISKIRSELKILLVLTDFYQNLSDFHDLPQVQSIYILNKNLVDKQNYPKVVNIFTDERMLIERLRQDILLTYRNDLPISISSINEISIEQTLTSFDKNSLLFRWNQLFIYYLVHSSNIDMNQLKKDMIEQCQFEYDNNHEQLDEFDKDCTQENVLAWYTKDTFVYRLVNKAFRTRNIHLICKFRYFIILLHNKLKELSIQQQGEISPIVYRGQMMKTKELETLQSNIGSLISMNTIMSTTTDENIARGFIAGAEVAVIFHINIRNTNSNHLYPFADISRFSFMPHEKEVLFFPSAVFRIDSFELENDSIRIVKLTLTNETIEDVEQITNVFDNVIRLQYGELLEKTDDYHLYARYHRFLTGRTFSLDEIIAMIKYINPVRLMNTAGDCQKSIEYYIQLLSNTNFINDNSKIILNIIIGNNYFQLRQYDEALVYYYIGFSLLDENNRLTGEVQNKLGDLYRERNDLENALSCYREAFKIISSHRTTDKILPSICMKIVDIDLKENNYENAKIYASRAHEIKEHNQQKPMFLNNQDLLKFHQHQPNIELDRLLLKYGHKRYTYGMHLVRKGDFIDGLENLSYAEQIFKGNLPFFDLVVHKLAKIYEHAAFAYSFLNDHFNALAKWRRAIDIRTSFLSIISSLYCAPQ
jgi:tetratricopeptide (TPR) repeat protein